MIWWNLSTKQNCGFLAVVILGFQGKKKMTYLFYLLEKIFRIGLDETGFFLLFYLPTIPQTTLWNFPTKYILFFFLHV